MPKNIPSVFSTATAESKGKAMSFTDEIKSELCGAVLPAQLADTLKYGILYGLNPEKPVLQTKSGEVRACVETLFGSSAEKKRSGEKTGYIFSIPEGFSDGKIDRSIVSGDDVSTGVFLRGVFLSCGRVSLLKAGYHLEISPCGAEKCESLGRAVVEQGMKINISQRRGVPYLYTKDSENIADFLTFIGAMQSAMEIMNVKIFKGVRSNVNRIVNCEAANIGKVADASARQRADIEFIREKAGLEKLPDELRELAALRLENPDMSLKELGALLDPPISRSGINHRLERLHRYAENLREKC